jgi:putative CocE/NonD family hydrolase
VKKKLFLASLLLLTVCGGALQQRHELFRRAAKLPAFTQGPGVDRVEQVVLRDGTKLHTEIYLPDGVEKAPTILVRNPYEYLKPIEQMQCQTLTRYGYACVLQDVRGQMASEGDWEPIIHEREDGFDTLAWLVKQPFVDGNIAMRGPSYLTCTQWAVADELPPEVKTLVPQVFGTDLRKVFYERGLFRHDILTAWATLMPGRGMRQLAGSDYLEAANFRPLADADEKFMTKKLQWYRDAQASSSPSAPYWFSPQMEQFRTVPERVKVPMLFIGGFFDPFFMAQRDSWERLATQSQSVFVLGPWNHLNLTSGDADFSTAPGRLDQWPVLLEWFDHTLKGKPLTSLKPGTVQVWGVGDSKYRAIERWPAVGLEPTTYQLGGGAQSNRCEGGVLSTTTTPSEVVSYTFDPKNPVPTRGGASLLSFAFFRTLGIWPGPVDQAQNCARDDVLTFKSEPVKEAVRLSGTAQLKLVVKSTAPDTAFVARLIAEQDGKALLVRENAATLAYPKSDVLAPQAPVTPGTEVEVIIDFWPIEWVLPAGARWRVDVMSSSFPALHVHSNRAGPWELEKDVDVATQTLMLGEGQAKLELPLQPP